MSRRDDRGKGREKEQYRVNRAIRAPEVRVIADDGTMLGVHTVPQALAMAEDKGLDLIEIAPNAKPPTCRIMDYGKWKYENKKKSVASRKKQTRIVIKEIQVRPRTEQHDLDTKLNHARRFLLGGDKVKVNLRFFGREMAHQNLGRDVLMKVAESLKEIAAVETAPKMEGRNMFLLLAPDPAKIKLYKESKEEGAQKDKKEAKPADA